MYIEIVQIRQILPCIADPEKIRVIAETNAPIGDILPYLNAKIPTATYSEKLGVLTYKKGTKLVTLYAKGKIMLTQARDEDEANKILEELRQLMNELSEKRDEIDVEAAKKKINLGPFDIYPYLPKENCKKCGESTCTAFAIKILNGEASISECPLMNYSRYEENRKIILELLKSAGYEVDVRRAQ